MQIAGTLSAARRSAGLTQTELARLARTSQPTISAYERGLKRPSVSTLSRLLVACGGRLEAHGVEPPLRKPAADAASPGKRLADVLALAEALPARRRGRLRYPTLHTLKPGGSTSPS